MSDKRFKAAVSASPRGAAGWVGMFCVVTAVMTMSTPAAAEPQDVVTGPWDAPVQEFPHGLPAGSAVRDVSPARRIERDRPPFPRIPASAAAARFRSIDGSGNNRRDPEMGQAGSRLLRLVAPDYGDGIESLAGAFRPSARRVSNIISSQDRPFPNPAGASDYLWQWGQFLDHDIDLTDGVDPPESAPILVPAGDPQFDPDGEGDVSIAFNRSVYDPQTGTAPDNPRQQINEITAWIDASNVYGSDAVRARALRTMDGTGRLLVSDGDLLPFNDAGLANARGGNLHGRLFLAGDVRANENVGLTAMHTLFVREHNRYVEELRAVRPHLSGEAAYQLARRHVGALIQVITFEEYLPVLLGPSVIAPYTGYRRELDATVSNLFATAAYRYGHSALSPRVLRVGQDGHEIPEGHLALRDAFFAPQRLTDEGGIDPILRGLALQRCESIDPYVIDDVRNFLFGPPGAGGFDLVALNIQRGRDHGLPSYNDVRQALGLQPKQEWSDISEDQSVRERLELTYDSIEDMDVWVGALAETPMPGAMVGELVQHVLKEQFEALRDGDRFWYERSFPPHEVRRLKQTRLADIVRRNTDIGDELPDDVFHAVTLTP